MHRAYSCYLIILCLFSNIIIRTNTQSFSPEQQVYLHLPKIPKNFYFYDLNKNHLNKIKFKAPDAYQKIILRWQKKLIQGSIKLFDRLSKELELTPQEIYNYTTNQQVIARYHILMRAEFILPNHASIILQENIDPEILLFLQSIFFKYTNKRNVNFFLTDHISTLALTYGSDDCGYFVFCNSRVYNKEHIQQYYKSLQNKEGYYRIESSTCENKIRWIETPLLLQVGLTEAASYVEHQTDLFRFILANYSFGNRKASYDSIKLYIKIQEFLALLGAMLQSHNPLEVAIFLMKMEHKSSSYMKLWQAIVQDVASTYDEQSLEKIKDFEQAIKKLLTSDT